MNFLGKVTLAAFVSAIAAGASAQTASLPVIPGAAGFGITTPAGRGGAVYRVTNLAASGAGSLDACIRASGPRVCVFEVGGIIELSQDMGVRNPYITIAGQTAPAPGITIVGGALQIVTSDVLVQHISVRVGDRPTGTAGDARDSMSVDAYPTAVQNIVIDHCSVSWAPDENLSFSKAVDNVAIMNSIIAEPLRASIAPNPQGYNSLIDTRVRRISFIGNLYAHGYARNPSSAADELVWVNNVTYNYGQEAMDLRNYNGKATKNSIVGNVTLKGPSTGQYSPTIRLYSGEVVPETEIHLADNLGYQPNGQPGTSDQWSLVRNDSTVSRSALEAFSPPTWPAGLRPRATANNGVLEHVLAKAGSRPAQRNDVDARIVSEVRNRTGRIINCVASDGSSRCSANAGGWPRATQTNRQLELPRNQNADDNGNGYTNLEEWLHKMAAEVEGVAAVAPPAAPSVVVQ